MIFTVGVLLVSEVFPDRTQALAGAVLITVGQFGQAIELALIGVVSDSVTQNSMYADKGTPDALLVGYRAGLWTCTGWMVLTWSSEERQSWFEEGLSSLLNQQRKPRRTRKQRLSLVKIY